MTNKIFKFVFLFLAIIIFISCGKKEEKTGEQIVIDKLESIDLKGEKVFLHYKFEKGDLLKYKLTTISKTDESIQADSLMRATSDQTFTYTFDVEALDVDADKIAELNMTITSLKIDANMNGQKISFDAGKKLTDEEKQNFIQYIMIYNIPFRTRVNENGEIVEVSRLDKMIDKMNSMQPKKQNLTIEQKTQLTKNLGEALIRPMVQLIFRQFPQNSVAKDSSWVKSSPNQLSVFKVENIAQYKVEDFVKVNDDNAVKVVANLTSTWEGNKKGEENGIKYNFEDPKFSGGGTILFNIDEGQIIKAETSTRVELSVHLEGKDQSQKIRKTTRKEISTNKNIVELL